jgi:hypothetical protein
MLAEAVELIRELLSGTLVTHHGRHYTTDTARLYSVPDRPLPIYVSGFGEKAVQLAARIGDGYMSVLPDADMVRLYRESGGDGRPVQGGLKVCWGPEQDRPGRPCTGCGRRTRSPARPCSCCRCRGTSASSPA